MLAALATVAGVLGSGAWMGGVRAGALPRRTLPEQFAPSDPHRAGEIPVGEALEVSGQPMDLSLFYTADPPARVAHFYADAFRARGLLPVLGADALAHVSVFDPATRRQRFVSAIAQPDGQTLVLVGAVDARRPPRFLRGAAEVSMPVPAEHRAFVAFRSSDGGLRAESAQFVSPLATGEVAGFYRKALAGEGFAEQRDSSDRLLTFARSGATFSVALQDLGTKQGAAAFVTRMETASP